MIKKKVIIVTMGICILTSCYNDKPLKAGYDGKDLTEDAAIIRDKNTKQAVLNINTNGEWALYAGLSVADINFDKPVNQGETGGRFELNVPTDWRSYFELVTPEGQAILAERHLSLQGGYNFRDLGGIRNVNGKYTKWGKVFRSDEMNRLTEEDLAYLSKLPITTIVDFRSDSEIDDAPDRIPSSVKEVHTLMIAPGNVTGESVQDLLGITAEEAKNIMVAVNKQLVIDPACYEQYKIFFRLLQNEENSPLLFHCTAGKDRTGYGAYLFLSSLGVDEDTIMKDYLSSNIYLKDKYGPYMDQVPNLKPLFEVKENYLGTAIKEIKERHGNVENYLTEVLEVDLDLMKEKYLY